MTGDVSISKNLGSYDFLHPGEKQWNVHLRAGDVHLSESWPEDAEPQIEDKPPSVVIEMMRERLKSYWISTRREEDLAKMDALTSRAEEIDAEWARGEIETLKRQATRALDRAQELERTHLTPEEREVKS